MDFGVCNCLKFNSRQKMLLGIGIQLVLLLLLGFSSAAEMELHEANCYPRPTVVTISDNHEYRPYHVILYRCEGSCSPQSPHVKACNRKRFDSIDVVVHDNLNRRHVKTMENHTECECKCKSGPGVCDWTKIGQKWQHHRCACAVNSDHPISQSSVNNKGDNKPPMPYIYGLVFMGVLVLCVLVFDAMLCARKKKGVMYCATRSCHRSNNNSEGNNHSEGNDNREEHQPANTTANGQTMNGTAQYLRASRTSIV